MKSIHTDLVVQRHGVVLDKSDHGFENAGALNPACIRVGDEVHMFYRAVRHGNYSTVGHCILKGPREVAMRADKPLMMPEHPYESQGIEDPRIVKIDDTYYMTYTVYDRMNALGAYATSQDLKTFIKHPVITPQFTYREFKKLIDCCAGLNQKYLFHYKMLKEHGLGHDMADKLLLWDKNLMFFPRKIDASGLRKKLKELDLMLASRDSSISTMKDGLLAKDFQIEQVNQQLTAMELEVAKREAFIEQQTNEMNAAWYVVGTSKELEERGVVTSSGGFIGIGKTAQMNGDVTNNEFQQVDVRQMTRVPLGVKKAHLVSEHPKDSYRIVEEGDELAYLEIKDPNAFWKLSRYMVVEVK